MIRKEREIKIIYMVVLAVFAVFLAVPIIRLLGESFVGEAGAGLANYMEVLTEKGFLQALGKQCDRIPVQCADGHSAGFFYGV